VTQQRGDRSDDQEIARRSQAGACASAKITALPATPPQSPTGPADWGAASNGFALLCAVSANHGLGHRCGAAVMSLEIYMREILM
jgi:hypothetical protein